MVFKSLRKVLKRRSRAVAAEDSSSSQPGSRRMEIIGLLAFCAFIVTLLSLVSYSTADGYGFNAKVRTSNIIGPAGAAMAYGLFFALGLASYIVSLGFLLISYSAFRRLEVRMRALESSALVLLALLSSAFIQVAMCGKRFYGYHAGGFIGKYSGDMASYLFSHVGALIILMTLMLLMLIYATGLSLRTAIVQSGRGAALAGRGFYSVGDWMLARIIPAPAETDEEREEPGISVPEKRPAAKTGRPLELAPSEPPAEKPKKASKAPEPAMEDEIVPQVIDIRSIPQKKKKEQEPKITVSEPPKKKAKAEAADDRPAYDPNKEFILPQASLLTSGTGYITEVNKNALIENANLLEKTLKEYQVEGKVLNIRPGPVITMYEFKPSPGIKVSKIAGLTNDLAMSLSALKVRIVAPIPGKDVVGIEVPNRDREVVYLREIIESESFGKAARLSLALGKDIEGTPVSVDLAKMPHLLVAGATGMGKSVSINSMVMSLLYKRTPEEVKMIMVDPKMVELKVYEGIPHLLLPVVTDPKRAALALRWAVDEMGRRYGLLAELGVREIEFFNRKVDRILKGEERMPEGLAMKIEESKQAAATGVAPDGGEAANKEPFKLARLPYIVIVVDEFADLMLVAPRDVESSVARLAQMARAVGIHIILATQRPSTDVISGVIKANFPARIAFSVFSQIDSRTILDSIGAEGLVGKGDMLLMAPGSSDLQRIHGSFVNENDIKEVVDFLKAQGKPVYNEEILKPRPEEGQEGEEELDGDGYDELYDQAVEIVCRDRIASISYLQRKLSVGYNRAAKLIEKMENEGVVGPANGSKQREVLAPPL